MRKGGYIYILTNYRHTVLYVGVTSCLEKRLYEHNNGEVASSSKYKPYEILFYEVFTDLKLAKARELFYKTSTGRYRLKKIVHQWKYAGRETQ